MGSTGENEVKRLPAELAGVIREAMERLRVPGVAVGVVSRGEEMIEGFGVTSVDNPLAVDGDTLFQIGSTTKTITGLVVMRLVERGMLDIDTPVRTYLPELQLSDPSVTERLTLRHLLTHTGGFDGDYFCDFGRGDDALAKAVASLKSLKQIAPLGEVWSYCNAGFYIAGLLIEVVTGKPYEAAARQLALDPIGLSRSFFFPEEVMTYRFAVGHVTHDDVHVARPWQLPRVSHAAGGIASTVRDNLKYARFLLADAVTEEGERLLSPESVALMRSPLVRAAGDDLMGLTWFQRDIDGVRVFRHGGGTNGQVSAFLFAPERDFALAVLTNAGRTEILDTILGWALSHWLGVSRAKPVPTEATEAQLEELAGIYDDIASTVEISLEDDRLRLEVRQKPAAMMAITAEPARAIPPMSVALSGPDRFVVLDGLYKDLEGDIIRRDGVVRWVRIGGRLKTRL